MPMTAREKAIKAVVKQEAEVAVLEARFERQDKRARLAEAAEARLAETTEKLRQAQKDLAYLKGHPQLEGLEEDAYAPFRKAAKAEAEKVEGQLEIDGAPDNEPRFEPDTEAERDGETYDVLLTGNAAQPEPDVEDRHPLGW